MMNDESKQETRGEEELERIFFRASATDFQMISGNPISYWLPKRAFSAFSISPLKDVGNTRRGLQTGDKDRFIRSWFEVCLKSVDFESKDKLSASKSDAKWFLFNNGGDFRKWYGNLDLVVDWAGDGKRIKESGGAIIPSESLYFDSAACWSRLSTGNNAFRVHPEGVIPGDLTPCFYSSNDRYAISYLNSCVANYFLNVINPTITKTVGDMAKIPAISPGSIDSAVYENFESLLGCHKQDWNEAELSWDFVFPRLLANPCVESLLSQAYDSLRSLWRTRVQEMQRLEEENNRIFIEAYKLNQVLKPKVQLKEITLNCNPHYRYGGDKTENELETTLLVDTMREFLSYAVGCMFGRYSLDVPGLVLANQGDTLAEYLRQIPEPRFMPDEDNVIPLLDGEWFADDVTERFRTFLRLTFGEEHYEENLAFVEQALGKDVRKYFIKDFYTDHVKRYKKRPIYWLFASPKGTFSALIYLHRYRPDTVSVVLQYLRDFRKKLADELSRQQTIIINPNAEQAKKTKAQKAIEILKKQLLELDDYERDTLYPLATRQVQLNLDDGVKFNYLQLGSALKKITGLEAKED